MDGMNHFRVGDTLSLIHQSISRGVHMSGLYGRIFLRCGLPDGKIRPGFADYIRSLVSVLQAHHLGEDKLAFPRFQELLPEAPYEMLTSQHHQMAPLLDEIRLKIDRAVEDGESQESLERLDSLLTELAEIWRPHIALEEVHFCTAKIDAVMDVESQARFLTEMTDLNQKHSNPDYLVVPFTLFNLPQEDRAYMSDLMPPVVTQQLIPVAWKDKWRPMSPFLLV